MIPDLAISIINHSNPQMLRDCLQSIYATTRDIQIDIWVIDNATDQHLVQEIRSEFPAVKWLFNPHRLGFSANHNQVLSQAAARYLCILNDDTIIHDNALTGLVKHLDAHPHAGMAGPRLLNRDGSVQNSTFRDKTLLGELIDICQLPGNLNHLKLRGIDSAQFSNHTASVDWLLGACIAIRHEALEQVGLLDDILSPIANCEEVDWCVRVRKSGWKIHFVPSATVTHFGGQSLKSDAASPDYFRIEMHRVMIAYFAKQKGLTSSLLLRAIYILALPWNAFMLSQSTLRGRLKKSEALSTWTTLAGIAIVALRPLPKPLFRKETVAPSRAEAKSNLRIHRVGV